MDTQTFIHILGIGVDAVKLSSACKWPNLGLMGCLYPRFTWTRNKGAKKTQMYLATVRSFHSEPPTNPQLTVTPLSRARNENLGAGGSYSAPRHFNVEATLWVLLAPQGWVVEGLMPCLPVTHSLPDGLQDTKPPVKLLGCDKVLTSSALLQSQYPNLTHSQLWHMSSLVGSGRMQQWDSSTSNFQNRPFSWGRYHPQKI